MLHAAVKDRYAAHDDFVCEEQNKIERYTTVAVFPHITECLQKRIVLHFARKPKPELLVVLRTHASYARFNDTDYGWIVRKGQWDSLARALRERKHVILLDSVLRSIHEWQVSDEEEAAQEQPRDCSKRPPWWKKRR